MSLGSLGSRLLPSRWQRFIWIRIPCATAWVPSEFRALKTLEAGVTGEVFNDMLRFGFLVGYCTTSQIISHEITELWGGWASRGTVQFCGTSSSILKRPVQNQQRLVKENLWKSRPNAWSNQKLHAARTRGWCSWQGPGWRGWWRDASGRGRRLRHRPCWSGRWWHSSPRVGLLGAPCGRRCRG